MCIDGVQDMLVIHPLWSAHSQLIPINVAHYSLLSVSYFYWCVANNSSYESLLGRPTACYLCTKPINEETTE